MNQGVRLIPMDQSWRARLRDWRAWRAQGCPTDEPVVLEQGCILVCPHGVALVADWRLTCRYQIQTVEVQDWIVRLSVRYGTVQVPMLDSCPAC